MHILVVPSFYPSDYAPRAGVFVRDQVDLVRGRGYEVGVSYVDRRSLHNFTPSRLVRRHYQISKEQFGIVPVVRCKAWNLRGTEYVMTKVGIRRVFRNKAREFGRPDLVHAHFGLYGGVAALELKQRFGIPFVLTEHSTAYANGMTPGGMDFVPRDVFKPAERVIVVSQALLGSVSPYHAGADVIPNTVDTDFFGSVQPKLSSRFEITSAGGLREVKDFDVLLDAYARLARVKAGVHLNIVGEGDLLCDLQNQDKDLNISDIVTFHGQLSRGDLSDLLRSSDLYVSASQIETFGVAIAEAISCGLPVVATRSGGPQKMATHPSLGTLVPVDDATGLALEMARAFDSRPELDVGAVSMLGPRW